MAYDPGKRAAREARFRAEHGVSSGTYYRMRREASRAGIRPALFDKTAKEQGYQAAKQGTIVQRKAYKASEGGRLRGRALPVEIDYGDLELDREWFWLKSPGKE